MRKNNGNIGRMMVKVVEECGPMGYRRLKNKTESKEYLNRILHSNTYNEWISKLRKCNILTQPSRDRISRRDGKSGGRSIPIELTYIAKKKLKLGILSIPYCEEEYKQKRLAELYQLILYFLAAKPGQYDHLEFRGDKQRINEVLQDYCSVDMLEEEGTIPHQGDNKIVRVVYKSPSPCLLIWKEIMTAVDKNKSGELYHVKILGLSVYEVCTREDRPFFKKIKFSPEEVQEAFDRLIGTGIMEKIGDIGGKTRCDVVDERFRDILRELWGHHEFVLNEMYSLYDTKAHLKHEYRSWLKERREWLDSFHGGGELDARIKIRNNSNECIEKEDANQWAEMVLRRYHNLKKRYPNEFTNYEFILDRLVRIAYPPFLERAVYIKKAKDEASFRKKHSELFYYKTERDKHTPGSQLFTYYSDKMVKYCMKH